MSYHPGDKYPSGHPVGVQTTEEGGFEYYCFGCSFRAVAHRGVYRIVDRGSDTAHRRAAAVVAGDETGTRKAGKGKNRGKG